MKLPDLPFKLPDMPRSAGLSLAAMAGAGALFALLFFTLGAARDSAVSTNAGLKNEAAQSAANLMQSRDDIQYINDHQQEYEALLLTDRLIPHTRLTAVRRMQDLALQRGLTALNYDFSAAAPTSAVSALSQPTAGDYRLNVETIKLTIGAPLDGKVYGFMNDLSDNFPGAAVVQSFDLTRAPAISKDMLDMVGANKDSGLVKGQITFLWRTAQANEKKPDANKK